MNFLKSDKTGRYLELLLYLIVAFRQLGQALFHQKGFASKRVVINVVLPVYFFNIKVEIL